MKINKVLLHTTWMNFINILLSEKSDAKECTSHDSIYIKFKMGKLIYHIGSQESGHPLLSTGHVLVLNLGADYTAMFIL